MAEPAPRLPGRADPLDRARARVPFLADRAAATEAARTPLPEVIDALVADDLFRIVQGPYLGGLGLDFETHLLVSAELARGCGSTAWVQCLVGYQNFLVGWYPKRAQDEVRAGGETLLASLVMGPPERAAAADGGIRLDGSWPYVSGADYTNWFLLSAHAPDATPERPRVVTGLIPRSEVEIVDDWHVMGMRGTGSKTVLLKDLFVPAHRVLSFRATEADGAPGGAVNPGPRFAGFNTSTLFSMVVAAPVVGLAEGALAAYRDRLATRTNARMPSAQTGWPGSQMRLGRAEARIAAARESFFGAVRRFSAHVEAGTAPDARERATLRMTVVQAVGDCTGTIYDLFTDAGTGVAREGDTLQRFFRDSHVLRSHFMLTPDLVAENAGRTALGQPAKPPFT